MACANSVCMIVQADSESGRDLDPHKLGCITPCPEVKPVQIFIVLHS